MWQIIVKSKVGRGKKYNKTLKNWAWSCIPVIPALRRRSKEIRKPRAFLATLYVSGQPRLCKTASNKVGEG